MIVVLVNAQAEDTNLPEIGNIVLPESIYVRNGTTREAEPIGELKAGQFVHPISINADGTWVFIEFNVTYGWVNRSIIRWTDDIDNLPVRDVFDPLPTIDPNILSATPVIQTPTQILSYVLIEAENAFIRSGPGRSYDVVGQIPSQGTITYPVGRTEDADWILFQYNDANGKQFGWILESLVEWLVDIEALPVLSEDALTPTSTFTPSNTPTHTFTPTSTFTSTATSTYTDTPTSTSTNTDTPTATNTTTNTPTLTSTYTDTPTQTATNTDVPTETLTLTSTNTDTPTETLTLTATSTQTDIPTSTFTATNTDVPTVTSTNTDVPTSTNTATATSTNTDVPTSTNTATATSTNTDVPTLISISADIATATSTNTDVPTSTNTATATSTNTDIPTSTNTATVTSTNTDVPTSTNTATATSTNTDVPTSTNTATATSTNTDVPTSTNTATATSTNTDTPTLPDTSTATDAPTEEATEDVTAIAAVVESNQPTPTQLSEIEITEVPPTDDTDTVGGRLPIEALIGIVLFIAVLLYIALYWNGLSLADRYADGFVIDDCPVCHVGKLHVESRQERFFGIPTTKHTVRCDNCRSVLRETGNRRWRYAVDRVENPDLFDRYNGKEIKTGELASLLVQKQSTLGTQTLPEFVDDDPDTSA